MEQTPRHHPNQATDLDETPYYTPYLGTGMEQTPRHHPNQATDLDETPYYTPYLGTDMEQTPRHRPNQPTDLDETPYYLPYEVADPGWNPRHDPGWIQVIQVVQAGSRWSRLDPGDPGWIQVVQAGSRWSRLDPDLQSTENQIEATLARCRELRGRCSLEPNQDDSPQSISSRPPSASGSSAPSAAAVKSVRGTSAHLMHSPLSVQNLQKVVEQPKWQPPLELVGDASVNKFTGKEDEQYQKTHQANMGNQLPKVQQIKEAKVLKTNAEVALKKRHGGCTGMFWRPDPSGKTQLASNDNWPRDGALLRGDIIEVSGQRHLLAKQVKQSGKNWVDTPAGAAMPFEYNNHYYLDDRSVDLQKSYAIGLCFPLGAAETFSTKNHCNLQGLEGGPTESPVTQSSPSLPISPVQSPISPVPSHPVSPVPSHPSLPMPALHHLPSDVVADLPIIC
eukprot:gene1435-32809_t